MLSPIDFWLYSTSLWLLCGLFGTGRTAHGIRGGL